MDSLGATPPLPPPRLKPGTWSRIGLSSPASLSSQKIVGAIFGLLGLAVTAWGISSLFAKPELVPLVAGFALAAMGASIYRKAQCESRTHQALARQTLDNPSNPALADWLWPAEGSQQPRWKKAFRGLGLTVLLTFLYAAMLWFFFQKKGNFPPVVAWIMAGVMGLALLATAVPAVLALARAWRFQPGILRWQPFPVSPGGSARFYWVSNSALPAWEKATMTLRACEQVYERKIRNQRKERKLRHYLLWEETKTLETAPTGSPEVRLEATFDIPAELPGTCLSRGTPLNYWELEVRLKMPGADLLETHLVPVYASKSNSPEQKT